MFSTLDFIVLILYIALITAVDGSKQSCKSTPDSPTWPSESAWHNLNTSISGRLLKPAPPGAVCHSDQPTYNPDTCDSVQVLWLNSTFHADNPISVDYENWNNDSCLPLPQAPCSGAGYPIYVVNASIPQHVKAGVDFARKNNIRVIVKTSGHDYLGRSSGANSLSIWVRHMTGTNLSSNFHPAGCKKPLDESSITVAAGVLMEDIYLALRPYDLAVVGGMGQDIGIGGYLTGGGHNAISPTYGLGADNVLEMEVVTPAGDILTVNECQHTDLFWALRGGGGSTFGVITKATLRTFKSPKIGQLVVVMKPPETASNEFWSTVTYLFQQMPALVDAGVSGYLYAVPADSASLPVGVTGPVFYALFAAVNKPSSAITAALKPIVAYGQSILPLSTIFSTQPMEYDNYYDWWWTNRDSSNVGDDVQLGSRLLNADVLAAPFKELKSALQTAAGGMGFNGIMVTGKGVWDAKPRGGGDAVNPAWRNNTMVHLALGAGWPPLNSTAKAYQLAQLEKRTGALRKLAPYSGCYLNEADADEPDFQHAFWGSHYARLLEIKRSVDPDDVFWCHACAGNERWKEEGGKLCRV